MALRNSRRRSAEILPNRGPVSADQNGYSRAVSALVSGCGEFGGEIRQLLFKVNSLGIVTADGHILDRAGHRVVGADDDAAASRRIEANANARKVFDELGDSGDP